MVARADLDSARNFSSALLMRMPRVRIDTVSRLVLKCQMHLVRAAGSHEAIPDFTSSHQHTRFTLRLAAKPVTD